MYSAPVAAPSLAEYSKGSSTLCDVYPCGTVAHAERVTVEKPGAVSLRPALAAGTKARIRYLFSSDNRNGSVSQECSPAVRGSRVYG